MNGMTSLRKRYFFAAFLCVAGIAGGWTLISTSHPGSDGDTHRAAATGTQPSSTLKAGELKFSNVLLQPTDQAPADAVSSSEALAAYRNSPNANDPSRDRTPDVMKLMNATVADFGPMDKDGTVIPTISNRPVWAMEWTNQEVPIRAPIGAKGLPSVATEMRYLYLVDARTGQPLYSIYVGSANYAEGPSR